ncbi:MAG: hypothetical protein KBC06_00680 [Candidatus Pacebacteria bacterium]|nr:hypothetical protein [Candidatus Paceibacterota bacterium]
MRPRRGGDTQMPTQDSTWDLVLGGVITLILLIFSITAFPSGTGFLNEVFYLLLMCIPWGWHFTGWKTTQVGFRSQALLFGARVNYFMGEGLHYTPWPAGRKEVDCREQVLKLDPVKAFTKGRDGTPDEVGPEVEVQATVTRRVTNLHEYFDVNEKDIKQWLDDTRDEVVRHKVSEKTLSQALTMGSTLAVELHSALQGKSHWGIEITGAAIPGIAPTDEKIMKDLALKEGEELQRTGQQIEVKNFTEIMKQLMDAGCSREQAFEQAQLTIKKATKTIDSKSLVVDATTASIFAGILGGKKP